MSLTKKVNHPQEILQKGQQVEVVILAVDGKARKITLGLKQLQTNPWLENRQEDPVLSCCRWQP